MASPTLLPLDEAAESQRATRVGQQFGAVAPAIVQDTTNVLFRDLWLRPDLAPRDRSLVTVSALIATGQVAQIPYHLNRQWIMASRSRRPPKPSRISPSMWAGQMSSRRFRWQRTFSRDVRASGVNNKGENNASRHRKALVRCFRASSRA